MTTALACLVFLCIGSWAGHRTAKGNKWAFPLLLALVLIWVATRTYFIVRL